WFELHDESLRRLEVICFSVARCWFDCRLPAVAEEEIEQLPSDVKRWMTMYSASPLATRFHPNKNELWLHWVLLDSTSARLSVLRRRLLPNRGPNALDSSHIPDRHLTWALRLASHSRNVAFVASRMAHHVRALPAVAGSALRWFGPDVGLNSQYWRFFLS